MVSTPAREVGSDGIAGNAFTTTTLATAVASFVWPMWEWLTKGKPSVLGFCSGAVAGLVVITPACGWVNPTGAVIIGIAAGTIPWFMCYKVKGWLGYDDALDTFGVHAIGGTIGAIMTGLLCDASVNSLVPMQTNGVANHAAQVDGTIQSRRRDPGVVRGRHDHCRLHHQGARGSASDRGSRNAPASTSAEHGEEGYHG